MVPVNANTPESRPSKHFGRAPFFALATVSGGAIQSLEFIENTARMEKARAGLAAIKHVFQSNRADAVLTREIGEIAFHALRDYYVEVHACPDVPLTDVLNQFARGTLPLLSGPTHASEAASAPHATDGKSSAP